MTSPRRSVPATALLSVAAGLLLAPAAPASVTVSVLPEPGSTTQDGVVTVSYDSTAKLRVVRQSPGAASGPIVVEALPGAPAQNFVVRSGDGCSLESPTRVLCTGSPARRPRSFVARVFSTTIDTADHFEVGAGIGAPPSNVSFTGRGDDVFDLSDAQVSQANAGGPRWTIEGGPGNDRLIGSFGPDILRGDDGDDVLAPRERLRSSSFVDELRGGAGSDTADLSRNHPDAFGVSRAALGAPVSLENLVGTPGNDGLTGNTEPNRIRGGRGNDTIRGGDGPDVLLGEGDADRVFGEEGDDQIGGFTDVAELTGTQGGFLDNGLREDPLSQFDLDDLALAPRFDGVDILDGGRGADLVKAQGDGKVDSVDCGLNGVRTTQLRLPNGQVVSVLIATFDRAILDLVDREDGDCELVDRSDRNERGTVQLLPQRVRGSKLAVRLVCPRTARTACRGRIGLVFGRRATTLAGGTPYRLAKGRSTRMALRAPRGRGVLRVRAVEQGREAPRTVDLRLSR